MAAAGAAAATTNAAMRWAAGGWSLFIAENLILSENRTWLIQQLGDEGYHGLYGTLSTVAMGSVAYGYRYKVRGAGPFAFAPGTRPSPPALAASFVLQALALGMASQSAPKLQIPVELVNGGSDDSHTAASGSIVSASGSIVSGSDPAPGRLAGGGGGGSTPPAATRESGSRFKIRCPFDFTDSRSQTGVAKGTPAQLKADGQTVDLHGLDRVTRHPGLWSFGLLGLGNALLVPSIPTRLWLSMPAMVALIGGSHTDSRHRRGMGGQLCEQVDEVTSNIPFLAMLMGRQDGGVVDSFVALGDELKVLNGALAAAAAALWVARRGRGGGGARPPSMSGAGLAR